MHHRPDPERLGGIAWLERTQGALSAAERRRLIRPILRGQGQALLGRLALLTGRRPAASLAVPEPPHSAMTRAAEDAAADQPAPLLGHAYRTWAFGRALAAADEEAIDDELFYVACLLHDIGLVEAVAGEDFTLRSGRCAGTVVGAHRPDDIDLVRDAISAHATPGASREVDGLLGFYVQAGAVCDLAGLRLHHVPRAYQDDVLRRWSRSGRSPASCRSSRPKPRRSRRAGSPCWPGPG